MSRKGKMEARVVHLNFPFKLRVRFKEREQEMIVFSVRKAGSKSSGL